MCKPIGAEVVRHYINGDMTEEQYMAEVERAYRETGCVSGKRRKNENRVAVKKTNGKPQTLRKG